MAALGVQDPEANDARDEAQVLDVHMLLVMYNALQPGVFALSGWDLAGIANPDRERSKNLPLRVTPVDQPRGTRHHGRQPGCGGLLGRHAARPQPLRITPQQLQIPTLSPGASSGFWPCAKKTE